MLPLLLLLSLGCSPEPGLAQPAEAAAAVPLPTASLRTAVVEAVSWRPSAELTGSLEPVAAVQLGFDVPGRLAAILVARGQSVRKGEPMARLESAVSAAQLAQAEAAQAGAAAQLAGGESTFARMKALKAVGGISDQQYSEAEASVLAGRAGVQQADAAVRMARTHLGFHTLVAPIDGVVTNGPDNAGILVGAGNPLFVIEDLSALQVKLTAPESADWIRPDLAVLVLPGTPGASGGVPAVVSRVIPALDPATRRIPVEIRIDAPPPSLRSHAFARVKIEAGEDAPAVAVPVGALVARPEFCVFVQDGVTPKKVAVEVLRRDPDRVIVHAVGLDAGMTVVVDPPNGLGG